MPAELLLSHAAVLALFYWLPGWAARRDAALFTANPTTDAFHFTFHRQRLLERLGIGVALLIVGSRASWPLGLWPTIVTTLGLAAAGAALWTFRFNRLLNVARALPYVSEYYVSADSRAAWFPDRLLWQRAVTHTLRVGYNSSTYRAQVALYAAKELKTLGRVVLAVGLVLEIVGLVTSCRIS